MVQIVGHRGAAGYEPENTIRAIKKGIDCGADWVEVDVRATKDGVLVLMHDDTVDRTTDGSGYLRNLTFDEVRRLDAGKGERVPTLEEALEVCKGLVGVLVEIKEPYIAENVARVVEEIGLDRVMIISFYPEALKRVKEISSLKTGLIYARNPIENLNRAVRLKVDSVQVHYSLLDREYVKLVKDRGLILCAWTVNSEREAIRVLNLGVDMITTDYPCLIRHLLSKKYRLNIFT
ncbi:MAG: glycerophosphodiester phosphodiesterase [Thermoprotei archaeon]|nr:MAG: glycerophosphodiester phosphodiesterase [Thermoprotei archaeon]RLF00789.1 MAG: glycerophosphodiester phosphodiesterase [Thermoprotei archaeon]HDI74527.1 glycerophosphodiester phosphodiesterase [Thermoprotei archaeon]